MVPERLGLDQAEVVNPHVHAARAQRHVGEDLGLPAGEQSRAVHAGRDVHLALDRPDLVLGAPVGPLLVDRDPAADDLLLQLFERARDLGLPLGIRVLAVGGARVVLEHLLLDRLGGVLAGELLGDLRRLVQLRPV